MAMKRKTFEMTQNLTEQFEEFCRSRCLIEKKVAAAALVYFMQLDATTRERVIMEFGISEEELAADPSEEPPRRMDPLTDGHDETEGRSKSRRSQ